MGRIVVPYVSYKGIQLHIAKRDLASRALDDKNQKA